MASDLSFRELILRARAGDERAAAELVRRYEPTIRRTVRVRLRDAQLRRLLDSGDVLQSVLFNFFVRLTAGQYDLDTPEALLRLLATMARNKLLNHAEHQQRQRRDRRRLEPGGVEEREVAAPCSSPSQHVMGKELLEEVRRRLSPGEQRLLELRQQERGWAEIAAELGGTPEGRRKELSRALDRVLRQLGLEEVPCE